MDNLARFPVPTSTATDKESRRPPKGSHYYVREEDVYSTKKTVYHLESTDEVNALVRYFLDKDDFRMAFFVVLGCNTGLRPSDVLDHRWSDIFDGDETIGGLLRMERKTGKYRKVFLNRAVMEMAWLYRCQLGNAYRQDAFCFPSCGPNKGRVPIDWRNEREQDRVYALDVQPMHIRSVTRIIRNAAKEVGLYRVDRHIAAYSFRKTALNVPTGLVRGVEVPSDVRQMMEGMEVARMMANHADLKTTANHYTPVGDAILSRCFETMNLGLEAVLAYKEAHGWGC